MQCRMIPVSFIVIRIFVITGNWVSSSLLYHSCKSSNYIHLESHKVWSCLPLLLCYTANHHFLGFLGFVSTDILSEDQKTVLQDNRICVKAGSSWYMAHLRVKRKKPGWMNVVHSGSRIFWLKECHSMQQLDVDWLEQMWPVGMWSAKICS